MTLTNTRDGARRPNTSDLSVCLSISLLSLQTQTIIPVSQYDNAVVVAMLFTVSLHRFRSCVSRNTPCTVFLVNCTILSTKRDEDYGPVGLLTSSLSRIMNRSTGLSPRLITRQEYLERDCGWLVVTECLLVSVPWRAVHSTPTTDTCDVIYRQP